MRTTIEMSDEQRARLLEIAARRGEKGFSGLVREAVAQYLVADEERAARVEQAVQVLGTLDDKAADRLERSVAEGRDRWRSS